MSPGNEERKPWPPVFWKAPQPATPPPLEPVMTRSVTLPEKVAVRYLAEEAGASLCTITSVIRELHIDIDVNRSVDFEDAAKVLWDRSGKASVNELYILQP